MLFDDKNPLHMETGVNEIESLHTDIQRFLAIFAFCLLPVFALVQSLPVVPEAKDVILDKQVVVGSPAHEGDGKAAVKLPEKPTIPDSGGSGKKEGLYVAFESDGAFLELLESGDVQLYVHLPGANQSFRVWRTDGVLHFKPGTPGVQIDLWEIKDVMIPGEIIDAFKRWTSLASKRLMYIVGLSPQISAQIREQPSRSGRILIGRDGAVNYFAGGSDSNGE